MSERARGAVTTALDVLGGGLLVAGVAMVLPWLAVSLAGVLVLAGSWQLATAGGRKR